MGMSASQARFLGLTARKTNVEFEGQQINQQRTTLSNQSANYYNDLLGMAVPVPPSVDDYTKAVYTFEDGALTNQITAMIAQTDGTYTVSYLRTWKDDFAMVSATTSIVNKSNNEYKVGSKTLRKLGELDGAKITTTPPKNKVGDQITLEDGKITNFIAEAGGYTYQSNDPNSQSFLAGNGLLSSLKEAFERFKFGGIPGSQQLAFYVNLKEIPNNRFGTQSEIYWDDAYMNAQVGAVARGTYSMKITNPIAFVSNFVPAKYLQQNAPVFDFADMDNDAGEQLFNEVVGSLSAAFSNYTNDPSKGNRITKIQSDQIGLAQSLSQAVEEAYQWNSERGLQIVKVAIAAIEYDEDTKKLLSDVKKADALSGARGNSFMQQSVARGFQAAGENGGGANAMAFMGMGMNAVGGAMGMMQQQPQQAAPAAEDPMAKLSKMKQMLDAGLITQTDYDAAKNKILGL